MPAASLYLVFGTLQSLPTFLDNSSFEFQLATFIYRLMDNTTVATLCELFIAELAPTYKHIGSMLNALLSYRTLNNVNRNGCVIRSSDPVPFPSQARKDESPDSADRFLKTALNFFRERKYKSCVESCDAGVENAVVATLLQLYPTRLEAPMTIEEQLSKLKSKGVSFRGERIIRLRRLRNNLTVSCREGTLDQAKWATRVLRMTVKTIEDFGKTTSGSLNRK
nr:hypothetical protein [Candidatus Njordarchaeum guaymaensis]